MEMPHSYLQDITALQGRLDRLPQATVALLGPHLDWASFCFQC